MLRQAAERTGDVVGDGTSTATILAQAIFADGLPNVVASASAIDIKRGLDRGVKAIVAALRQMSRPVATRKEKAQVAINMPTVMWLRRRTGVFCGYGCSLSGTKLFAPSKERMNPRARAHKMSPTRSPSGQTMHNHSRQWRLGMFVTQMPACRSLPSDSPWCRYE